MNYKTLLKISPLSADELAEVVGVSPKTLLGGGKLSKRKRAKLKALHRLFVHARRVLRGDLRRWFCARTGELKGLAPKRAIRTGKGIAAVDEILGRLEWGLPA